MTGGDLPREEHVASSSAVPHVVILGGGFGGLAVARALRRAAVDVTLVDRQNHHLFQPLLYQVATGALSPANIAVPLRSLLRYPNTRVLLAEVEAVEPADRRVRLADGGTMSYDYLVVATGSVNHWFGNDDWRLPAPGLKTIAEATAHRARILRAFEEAELLHDELDQQAGLLTFVIIGGGPTGVELAGAIAELARDTLRHDFHHIDPGSARVVLIEAAGQLLPAYPASLAARAQRALEDLGVRVRLQTAVTGVDAEGVTVRRVGALPGEGPSRIASRTVIWAAGVRAGPLAARLTESAGLEADRAGRVPVQDDLTLRGFPEVSVIGDMAAVLGRDGKPLPGLAPVAIQEGRYAAAAILDRIAGRRPAPFVFRDPGSMATVGRGFAVLVRGRVRLAGFLGWVGWLFLHLMQVVEFENRVLVATQWAWSYVTRNRTARLIVEREDRPREMEPGARR